MISSIKRSRGRPRGSGKDDRPVLRQVAELMSVEPKLKKTTAIRRVIARMPRGPGDMEKTILRRLQHKWNVQGQQLLEDVRRRRAEETSRRAAPASPFASLWKNPLSEYSRMLAQIEMERLRNPFPASYFEALRFAETRQEQVRQWAEIQRAAEDAREMRRALEEAVRVHDAFRYMYPLRGF